MEIKEWIEQCDDILESKDINAAKEMIRKIVKQYSDIIPQIKKGLSLYRASSVMFYNDMETPYQIDYLGDLQKLRDKLVETV